MSDPFEIGRRVVAECRRLLAPPTLAGLPPAYASLLQDPGEALEAAWGRLGHGAPAPHEGEAALVKRAGGRSRAPESFVATAPAERTSGGSPFSPFNAAPLHVALRGLVTRVPPPGLPRPVPPFSPAPPFPAAPLSKDDGPASLSHSTAAGVPPLELAQAAAAPEEKTEPYGPERVYRERAKKVVEWPAVRPATAGDATLAAPGNALQETEERLGADPELQRLRSQLAEDDGRRGRLQQVHTEEPEGLRQRVPQGKSSVGPSHSAHTPTSFSPLSSLLSKNVAGVNGSDASAPPAQGPEDVVAASMAPGEDAPSRAARGEADERRAGRVESTGAAPSVDEVLDELYERLRLEFLRTYGTTGG